MPSGSTDVGSARRAGTKGIYVLGRAANALILGLATDISAEADALNAIEDSPPGHCAAGKTCERRHLAALSAGLRGSPLAGNRPNEAGELARDRGGDRRSPLVFLCEPDLDAITRRYENDCRVGGGVPGDRRSGH